MKKFYALMMRHWTRSPGKVSLTLLALALGTGILILSFSAGLILKREVSDKLDSGGSALYVVNGNWASDGTIDQQRPPQWDASALDIVVSDIDPVIGAAPVMLIPFNEVTVQGNTYRVRSALGTTPDYFDVFSLEIVAGTPMEEQDISLGTKSVWISETTAILLFGSPEKALGQYISPPGMILRLGPGGGRGNSSDMGGRTQGLITQFSVKGIFSDPPEIARKSYGIADLIFPHTSLIPSGSNTSIFRNFTSGLFVVQSRGASAERVSASIQQVLSGQFGEDTEILVWEGSPRGISSYMEELRGSVRIFTISVNILGIILLITSALGIFSIMVVEALGRKRDIALERALGASQGFIVKEFWTWSIIISLAGAFLGVILALALSKPVLGALSPLLGEISRDIGSATGVRFSTVVMGVALALGCGGILGLLPALSAVKGNIADTLREV